MSVWDLNLVDMCVPSMAGVETCVGTSESAGTSSAVSGAIRLGSCEM